MSLTPADVAALRAIPLPALASILNGYSRFDGDLIARAVEAALDASAKEEPRDA